MVKLSANKGLTLIEMLVGVSIIASFLIVATVTFKQTLDLAGRNTRLVQAAFLAEEGQEVLRLMRDEDWETKIAPLALNTDYYLEFSGSTWQATTTNIFIDSQFERKFILRPVNRSVSKDVVESGGSLDPETIKGEVVVAWRERTATTSRTISTYLTKIFDN